MNCKHCVLVGMFLLIAIAMPHAIAAPRTAGSQEQFDQRYLLLATSRTSTMQAELDEAAAANYRLLSTWWAGSEGEMFALLEKGDDPELQREYRLLAALNEATLDRELREAAAQGFRVTPAGLLRNTTLADESGEEIVLILERTPGETERHEYSLIDVTTSYFWDKEAEVFVGQLAPLQAELARLPEEGYRIVAHLGRTGSIERRKTCAIHNILIAEKLPDSGQGSGQNAMGRQERYLLIEGRPGADVQRDLNEATAAGYRLRFGSMIDLPDPDHLTLIMELASDTSNPPRYLLIGSAQCCLANQLELAGERGYLAHPRGIFREPLIAIMERGAGDQPALDYEWIETDRSGTFQEELTERSAAGYELVVAIAHQQPVGSQGGWSLNSSTQVGWLAKVGDASPSTGSMSGVRTDVEWKTLGMPTRSKDEEIQEQLNEAARDGYCLVNLASFHDGERYEDELSATMEKRGNSPECEYIVLSATRGSTMQKEIDAAAGEGFRLLKVGLFAKSGLMIERGVLMERTPGTTTPTHEYLMLTTGRESTLLKEIEEAALDGYELLARGFYSGHTAYLERPVRDLDQ